MFRCRLTEIEEAFKYLSENEWDLYADIFVTNEFFHFLYSSKRENVA